MMKSKVIKNITTNKYPPKKLSKKKTSTRICYKISYLILEHVSRSLGGPHQYFEFLKHAQKINFSVYNDSMEFKLLIKNLEKNITCHLFLRFKLVFVLNQQRYLVVFLLVLLPSNFMKKQSLYYRINSTNFIEVLITCKK